jgi:rfaE bifunctional protein kinase chain/domain
MDRAKLERILESLKSVRLAVFGDFFLDRYFVIESALAEVSIETSLTAHQVVGKRLTPGAAGTVVSNLRALGVGQVLCIGLIGTDGEGYELKKALSAIGATHEGWLVEAESRFTPCYTKPMLREGGVERELERIDIKNREPVPGDLENAFLARLRKALSEAHGVVIADQVQERNCGVVTDRAREVLSELAAANPGKVLLADSRTRIGEFQGLMLKPNRYEASAAFPGMGDDLEAAKVCAMRLREAGGKPVFMTAQEQGIFVFDDEVRHVPAVKVEGEIDQVGAGDACTAGIVSALCAGASLDEAALIGNLAASVVIQKIGQTGTASPEEVMARFEEYGSRRGQA